MRCLVGLVSAVLLCLLVPTAAVAETDGWATMVSTRGDGIGQGTHRTFDTAAGDAVTAGTDDGDLQVWVSGGPGGEGFEMEFAAPAGQALAPGVYLGAQRSVFRAAGRPGIAIGGEGRGCSLVRGGFELRELAVGADGSVTRLWLLYEQRCELGPELFGEVRIGAPPTGGLRTVPSVARFPGVDAGNGGHTIQVTVPDASLADVQLVGDGASQFIVRDRQCADVGCEVWVRYTPDAAGTHRAWLRLTDALGRRADVPLQGFAYGGTNRLTIVSDPGDPVGNGRSYAYGPEAWFGADQSYSTIMAGVFDGELKGWSVSIDPPNGEPLTAGRTYEAGSGSGQGSLSVTGQSGYCERRSGRFTVDELVRSYDTVRLLKVSFVYHCNENPAGMRGTLSFRAGDTTPPAPWMLAGPGATDLGTAPGALPVPSATPTPAPSATPVAPPPGGGPGLPATVTLVSEGGGDWILGGGTRRFDAVTEDITPTMRGDGWLDLSIYGEYDEFFLGFQAARGPLVPGVYTRARAVGGGRGAGRPGLDIWGNGRACTDVDGAFEVRELVLGPGGKVERAWVLFEQHCEGVVEALHGEVRIGAPAVSGPRTVPTHVRWPDRDHGARWRDVPVNVRPGAAQIERVEIVGADASDITVVSNGCAGAVAACDVRLRFQSGAPGARRAWLRVTDAAGARADVPLQGFAYGGETGLTVNYHNSDSRGVYGPDSRYRIWLSRSRLRLDVDPVGGGSRDLRLEPALGDVLAPGTYTDVAGYPNNAHLPGMSFASNGSDCSVPGAKFTIHRFKLVAGEVKELALDFETACGTFKPYGTFNFRKGDTTPLAPWMVTGPVSDTGVAPGATPTPTPTPTSTSTPTATPTPSPTPTATPTPSPMVTPTPTATPTPTPMPTATSSPSPTATPASTATPTPSPASTPAVMPTPTPSAAPAATPTASPSATPAATATPAPDPSAVIAPFNLPPVFPPATTGPPAPHANASAVGAKRVAASAKRLLTAVMRLGPRRTDAVRRAAARLAADLSNYRATLPPIARAAVDRRLRELRALRRALTRYERSRDARAAQQVRASARRAT